MRVDENLSLNELVWLLFNVCRGIETPDAVDTSNWRDERVGVCLSLEITGFTEEFLLVDSTP